MHFWECWILVLLSATALRGGVLYTHAPDSSATVYSNSFDYPSGTCLENILFGVAESIHSTDGNDLDCVNVIHSNSVVFVSDTSLRDWRSTLALSFSANQVPMESVLRLLSGSFPSLEYIPSHDIHYFFKQQETLSRRVLKIRGKNLTSFNIDDFLVIVKNRNGERLVANSTFVGNKEGFYTAFIEYEFYLPCILLETNRMCKIDDPNMMLFLEIAHGNTVVGSTVIENPMTDPFATLILTNQQSTLMYSDKQLADSEYGFWFQDGTNAYAGINESIVKSIDLSSVKIFHDQDEMVLCFNANQFPCNFASNRDSNYHFIKIDSPENRKLVLEIPGCPIFILPQFDKPAEWSNP